MFNTVTARFGLFVRHGLLAAISAVALALMAAGAYAAPYADFVIDARTGEVLHSENADTRLHPASLTKMMTLYIAFEAIEHGEISLDSMVTISARAAAEQPSKLGLKPGQKIALRYLIRAAAVKSANDAATAIGEAIEGSEAAFARRMNRTAKALGMTRSTFKNAHGLTEEGHLSTARDMTTLGRHLFYDYPQYYHLFSRITADAGVAQVAHTNRRFLGSYKGADGIKTGYTVAAGFNLVASAQRGNKRIIATVFGGRSTASRNDRVAELMDAAFGEVPNKARTSKPAGPDYAALDAEIPNGEPSDDPRASGKKIRVSGSVTKSPRPRARPVIAAPAPELLLAMQSNIDSVLAEVQGTAAPVEAAAATPKAPVVNTAVALADALAETSIIAAAEPEQAPVPDGPVMLQTTEPQPETLQLAADLTDEDVDGPAALSGPLADELVLATGAPELTTRAVSLPSPMPRPDDIADTALSDAALAVAEAPKVPEVAEPAVMAIALAKTAPPARPMVIAALTAEPTPTPPGEPATEALPDTQVAALSEPAPEADVEPVATVTLAASVAPPPARPDALVLAAAQAAEPVADDLEVVTRVSSSGGRLFAISVGRYGSRFEAEQVLMKTALSEMDTLSDALRKVMPRKGAYDATFVGLSEEGAGMACRRLAARGNECTVLAP